MKLEVVASFLYSPRAPAIQLKTSEVRLLAVNNYYNIILMTDTWLTNHSSTCLFQLKFPTKPIDIVIDGVDSWPI